MNVKPVLKRISRLFSRPCPVARPSMSGHAAVGDDADSDQWDVAPPHPVVRLSSRRRGRSGLAQTTRNEAVSRPPAPGALFEIRTENVLGDQLDVFACRHRSLAELVHASQRFGEREYLVTEHERISFARHYAMVAGVAGALREEYGVGRGDRVAICAANSPEWIITYWAAVSIGAVVVGMNSWWAAPEVAHGLRLSDPAVLIADEPRRELAGSPGIPVLAIEEDVRAL